MGEEEHGLTHLHTLVIRDDPRALGRTEFCLAREVSPRVAWALSMPAKQVSLTLELFQSFDELRGDQVK